MATSLKIDDDLKSRVQQLASQRCRSAHWIMLEAIQQYVDREEARESFKQEALASWAAYQETGKHLTGEEVRNWLNTWGTNNEKAAPECHESSSRKTRQRSCGRTARPTPGGSRLQCTGT